MDPELDACMAAYVKPPSSVASSSIDNPPLPPRSGHPLVQPELVDDIPPTNIYQDIWHEMEHVNKHIPKDHSLKKEFVRRLSDIMLVPDQIDKARVEAVLRKKGITWDQALRSRPDWVWLHVRRYAPPPLSLTPVLRDFFKSYANLRCSRKNIPLLNAKARKAADLLIEDSKTGVLSDPSGYAVYNRIGMDFPLGTASGELVLWRVVSICQSGAVFRRVRYSGSLHGFGTKYNGHYDLWIEDEIDIAFKSLPFDEPREHHPGYINILLFKPTHETFLITALPDKLRTDREVVKFQVGTAEREPNFKAMAKAWNSTHANGKTVFYKLPEQLQNHFQSWKAARDEVTSLHMTAQARAPVMDLIRSDAHTSVVLDEAYSPVIHTWNKFSAASAIANQH
ncbi:hypothetical protein C8F01DRAFT_1242055 [Mycena amicta]|nr:hypothetical protein C8F01DRAFT_1242055 [Mycena amicta]